MPSPSAPRHLARSDLALNHIQREVIRLDPRWNHGSTPTTALRPKGFRSRGRSRCCPTSRRNPFDERYGRKLNRNGEDPWQHHAARFDVGGYLDHQGEKFVRRFDANSYLSITRTMDTFDPVRKYGSAKAAYSRIKAKMTLVGISSDWLFPAARRAQTGGRNLRSHGARLRLPRDRLFAWA